MNRCVALVALTFCALATRVAHADQCAWVSPQVAARASQVLANDAAIVDYCEPCGDAAPGTPRQVGDVSVRAVGDGFRELVVDGRSIDLAYVYLRTAPSRFENLAALTGCPATGVSPALDIGGTAVTGRPSRADEADFAAAPTRFATPPPPVVPSYFVAPPPPPPAPPVHVVEVSVAPAWIIALVAATSTLTAALAFALVALARRRRQAALPRALGLVDRK